MDQPITIIVVICFILLVAWGWFRRWSSDYEGDMDTDYDSNDSVDSSTYDDSNDSWTGSSRRSGFGGSLFGGSSRSSSSSHSTSHSSPSVTKSQPTKTYDSPKIQSHGGFGRGKK